MFYLQTGTLTEDGLEVWGVVGVEKDGKPDDVFRMAAPTNSLHTLKLNDPLTVGLACCHSLTFVNGELIGDPLDIQMFKATNWVSSLEVLYRCGEYAVCVG